MASNTRRLGTQENSNKYLPVNWTKQTMKCYTATVRRERAQARGRVGMVGLLKAPGKGLASTIPSGCKAFNALRMWLSGRLLALTLGSIS